MPESSILLVVARSAFMFTYTFIVLRVTGRHQLAQLTLFDLLIVIALGSAVGDAMIYPESTAQMANSMVAIAVVAGLHWVAIKLSERSYGLRVLLYGKPELLIKNGVVIKDNLLRADLTMDMLKSLLREHDIGNIKRIRYAYMEPNGKLGIIRK